MAVDAQGTKVLVAQDQKNLKDTSHSPTLEHLREGQADVKDLDSAALRLNDVVTGSDEKPHES